VVNVLRILFLVAVSLYTCVLPARTIQLHIREIVGPMSTSLQTANGSATSPTIRRRVLSAIASPDMALVLLLFGVLGVCMEFCRPGSILPGVLGATFATVALASLAEYPIAWRGALLTAAGLACLAMEARQTMRSVQFILAAAAAIMLTAGASRLIDSDNPALHIHLAASLLVIPIVLVMGVLLSLASRARRNKGAAA